MSFADSKREISKAERFARLKLQLAKTAEEMAGNTHYAVLAKIAPIRRDACTILASEAANEPAKLAAREQQEIAQELAHTSLLKFRAAGELVKNANAVLEAVLAECNPEFRAALLADRVAEIEMEAARVAMETIKKADYESDSAKAAAVRMAEDRFIAVYDARHGEFDENDWLGRNNKGPYAALRRIREKLDGDWEDAESAAANAKADADYEATKTGQKTRLQAKFGQMAVGGDIEEAIEWLARADAAASAKADAAYAARDAIADAWRVAENRLRSLTDSDHPDYVSENRNDYERILASRAETSDYACAFALREREWRALAAAADAAGELRNELDEKLRGHRPADP